MAEVDELQRELLSRQNGDGGWGYQNATSWTEPTALALLALEASKASGTAHDRGCKWLLRHQRKDGGWPPNPSVAISTSVTSFASLALSAQFHSSAAYDAALHWIVSQIKPDLGPIGKLEFRLGRLPDVEATAGGSPWFPGTAAWVAPTCMTILALSAAARLGNRPILKNEITRGQQYLLSRRCFDGGWNHGGTQYRSERAESYPETTGMALVALQGLPSAELARSLRSRSENATIAGFIRSSVLAADRRAQARPEARNFFSRFAVAHNTRSRASVARVYRCQSLQQTASRRGLNNAGNQSALFLSRLACLWAKLPPLRPEQAECAAAPGFHRPRCFLLSRSGGHH